MVNRIQNYSNSNYSIFSTYKNMWKDGILSSITDIYKQLNSSKEIKSFQRNFNNIPGKQNLPFNQTNNPLLNPNKSGKIIFYSGEGTIQGVPKEMSEGAVALHEAHHIPEHIIAAEKKGYKVTSQYIVYYHKTDPRTGESYIAGGKTTTRMVKKQNIGFLSNKIDLKI